MVEKQESPEKPTAFKKWYENNRAALAEKRHQRYLNDPEYRAKALANKAAQTAKVKAFRLPLPPEYTHTLETLSEGLGVTVWTLREWRKKKYFPEPYKYGQNVCFTEDQVALLQTLKTFFDEHGNRSAKRNQEALDNLVSLIFANW